MENWRNNIQSYDDLSDDHMRAIQFDVSGDDNGNVYRNKRFVEGLLK